MWFITVLRNVFFWIDMIIYSFISTVYNLLFDITNANVFDSKIFEAFSTKIYTLIGIFMLFRTAVSIFTYIVDPDAFLDKSKGFGKLVQNILMTLIILVFVPFGFKLALDLQEAVLKSNFIGRLFMLDNYSSVNVMNPGDQMAYETLTAFYHIDTITYPNCSGDPEMWNGCDLENNIDGNYDEFKKHMSYGYDLKNVNLYMNYSDLNITDKSTDQYVMSYLPIISTVAGGAVVLLLLVFCFDVAVRNIKLGFLQMIAPLPIISRIDPKKGKELFDKWLKTCVSTYLDLFIRLIAINFAIFVISLVSENIVSDKSASGMVKVFIIMGALLFAKELPNLIKDITGFDAKGSFTFNPLKRLNDTGVPMALGATGAYVGSRALGFVSNFKAADKETPMVKKLLSAYAGMTSSGFHTVKNIIKNKGKNNFGSMTQGVTTSSNNRRNRKDGYGIGEKVKDYFTDISGIKNETGTTSLRKNDLYEAERLLENAQQNEKALREAFVNQVLPNPEAGNLLSYFKSEMQTDPRTHKPLRDDDGNVLFKDKSYAEFRQRFKNTNISETDFNAFLSRFKQIETLDNETQAAEKKVKDIKDQIEKSKKQSN